MVNEMKNDVEHVGFLSVFVEGGQSNHGRIGEFLFGVSEKQSLKP